MNNDLLQRAFEWTERNNGESFLREEEYCPTRDIFQGRLERLRVALEQESFEGTSLFVALAGELGNNAFDHNIGNWRDVPGIYFYGEAEERRMIIADRGQGVFATLSRVEPALEDDVDAVEAAFTRKISGRSPEQRGNGLKFVKAVIERKRWSIDFYSGSAQAIAKQGDAMRFEKTGKNIMGTIAYLFV